jgi:hypothetical protein
MTNRRYFTLAPFLRVVGRVERLAPAWVRPMHGSSMTGDTLQGYMTALRTQPFTFDGRLLGPASCQRRIASEIQSPGPLAERHAMLRGISRLFTLSRRRIPYEGIILPVRRWAVKGEVLSWYARIDVAAPIRNDRGSTLATAATCERINRFVILIMRRGCISAGSGGVSGGRIEGDRRRVDIFLLDGAAGDRGYSGSTMTQRQDS